MHSDFDPRLDVLVSEMQRLDALDLNNLESVIKTLKDGVLPQQLALVAICAALKRIEDQLDAK
jgi:hypothetical protein